MPYKTKFSVNPKKLNQTKFNSLMEFVVFTEGYVTHLETSEGEFLFYGVTHDLETKQILNACLGTKSQIIALMPNSDSGGEEIRKSIESFKNNQHIKILTHVQRNLFLSLLNNCDLLLGNSSSGIIEAASFGIPVINIGNRQNLRERNANVIDIKNNDNNLSQLIKAQLVHGKYQIKNIYKQSNTCETIVQLLTKLNLDKTILNKFNTY